jgi:hypothetical protein
MENNAIINMRLKDLLEVLDARTTVNIFVGDAKSQTSIKYIRVYEILTEPEIMSKYGARKVIGLQGSFGATKILIEEA